MFTRNNVQIRKVGVNGFEMLNSKKFFGDIEGNVKPYIIQDTNNFDQPIVSYQAFTGTVTQLPPNQLQLIVPDSSKTVTINHSTGLLKTKNIYVDGNVTGNQFIGSLSGSSDTVTNGVYLNNSGTQTINGNVSVKQIDIDGTRCIYQQDTGGTDTRANLRVLANLSTDTGNQDGMLINYGSTGAANANIKFYAHGTTERMRIRANTGNVGINKTASSEKLEVGGNIQVGNNSYFMSEYNQTINPQFFGKIYYWKY